MTLRAPSLAPGDGEDARAHSTLKRASSFVRFCLYPHSPLTHTPSTMFTNSLRQGECTVLEADQTNSLTLDFVQASVPLRASRVCNRKAQAVTASPRITDQSKSAPCRPSRPALPPATPPPSLPVSLPLASPSTRVSVAPYLAAAAASSAPTSHPPAPGRPHHTMLANNTCSQQHGPHGGCQDHCRRVQDGRRALVHHGGYRLAKETVTWLMWCPD